MRSARLNGTPTHVSGPGLPRDHQSYSLVSPAILICTGATFTAFHIYAKTRESQGLKRLGWVFLARRQADHVFEAKLDVDGSQAEIGASIGIALYPDDGATAAQLLSKSSSSLELRKLHRSAGTLFRPPRPDRTDAGCTHLGRAEIVHAEQIVERKVTPISREAKEATSPTGRRLRNQPPHLRKGRGTCVSRPFLKCGGCLSTRCSRAGCFEFTTRGRCRRGCART